MTWYEVGVDICIGIAVFVIALAVWAYVTGTVLLQRRNTEDHFDYLRGQHRAALRTGRLDPDRGMTAHADGSVTGTGPDGEPVTIPAADLFQQEQQHEEQNR